MSVVFNKEYLNQCFVIKGGDLLWGDRPRSHFRTNCGYKKYVSSYKGNVAGSIQRPSGKKNQYRVIHVGGRHIFAHRAVYIMTHGNIPDGMQVDHIDGNGLNNSISNLRLVNNADNHKNMRLFSSNSSGCVGVSYSKERGKWEASIYIKGKNVSLGRHLTIFDAACARKSAENKYGFHENHGRK